MQRGSRLWAASFILPALCVYALFVLWPIADSFWVSLHEWQFPGDAHLIGVDNYVDLLKDGLFWRALGHNILLVVLSVAIQLPIAMGLAVLLSYVGRTQGLLRTALFAPMVLPTVAIGALWLAIYHPQSGPLNELLRLFEPGARGVAWLGERRTALLSLVVVISWRYIGFHMVLFIAGIESIPQELYEAARVDGAGEGQIFRHVTLPHLMPVVRVSAVLSIIGSLKYFDLVWIMTRGGPFHATELVATYVYKTGVNERDFGYGSTLAVALLVLSLALTTGVVLAGRARRRRYVA